MATLFFPPPRFVPSLVLHDPQSIRGLCAALDIPCRATGPSADRRIEIRRGNQIQIFAEPGAWGNVSVVVPATNAHDAQRMALEVLAYGLFDIVARESIKGESWTRVTPPRGRRRTGRALTAAERQRRFRAGERKNSRRGL